MSLECSGGHFSEWELRVIRADALCAYRLLKNSVEVSDLARAEATARAELEGDAFSLFDAIGSWRDARSAALTSERPLHRLIERLAARTSAASRADDAREAALRGAGRAAWRREAAALQARREAAEAEAERMAAAAASLRLATAFLAGEETRRRGREVEAEAVAMGALGEQEAEGRAEAERLAMERFLNSPEQLALRAERERKEAAAAKAAARRMRRFLDDQKQIVTGCKHGRGHTSMMEGPQARRLCVMCAVKFDETLGYFVRMRGKTMSPPPNMPLPAVPVRFSLPSIAKRHSSVVVPVINKKGSKVAEKTAKGKKK